MLIRRTLLSDLRNHLPAREITLLVGARQVGKTTLLRQLQKELSEQGEKVVFLNLDFETDWIHFQSQERLLNKLRLETGGEKGYIFIDEIQRKENAGLFLKGIYDQNLPYKFIVSGSGSLELKEKIHESLAGRKRLFELWPVSIWEFIDYRTDYRYSDRLHQWLTLEAEKRDTLLLEYLNYGGYPRVATETEGSEKQLILQEIFQSYLERDLLSLIGLEKPRAFTLLFRLLANQAGQHINYSNLARETGLSQPTLKDYLWYAEKTFSIRLISPFFKNKAKELVKAPQVYFKDLGMRNLAVNLNGRIIDFQTAGLIFENFVFQLLAQQYESLTAPLRYWRTKDQAEVDFVLDRPEAILPIEVKCQHLTQPKITRSLRNFIHSYSPPIVWVVNLSLEKEIEIEGSKVRFRPWYQLS